MLKLAVLVIGFALSVLSHAGETKAYYFVDDQNWGPDRYIVIDGTAHKIHGFSMLPEDFENLLKANPKAAEYASLAKSSAVKGNWMFWGFIGASILYSQTSGYNAGLNSVLILTGAFGGGYFFGKSQNNMWKAINAYNGIDAESLPAKKSGFWLMPAQDGAYAQAVLTF